MQKKKKKSNPNSFDQTKSSDRFSVAPKKTPYKTMAFLSLRGTFFCEIL
jgi:hypothetical protein